MVITFIASGAYSAVLLGSGFYAGHLATKVILGKAEDRRQAERNARSRRERQLQAYREHSARIMNQSQAIRSLAAGQQPAIAPPLMQAIEQLASATQALSTKVSRLEKTAVVPSHSQVQPTGRKRDLHARPAKVDTTKPVPTNRVDHRETQAFPNLAVTLTTDEIRGLSGNLPDGDFALDEPTVRHRYACEQYLAAWAPGEPLPPPEEFILVKCRDISAGGISFFVEERPTFEHFIIGIGPSARPLLMAGEVLHSRAVYMYGEVGYLTGCKFIKRIEALPDDWALPCIETAELVEALSD